MKINILTALIILILAAGCVNNQIEKTTIIGPKKIALDTSISILNNVEGFFFKNHNQQDNGCSLATLARDIAAGNRDKQVLDLYVASIRKLFEVGHMPSISGDLNLRSEAPALFAIAIGLSIDEIRTKFTQLEQQKLQTMIKSAVAACSFYMAQYLDDGRIKGDERPSMVGKSEWTNANYQNPVISSFLSGLCVLGKEGIKEFLENYNHKEFVDELKRLELTEIVESFNKTFIFETQYSNMPYDASTFKKKAELVENILHNIDNNDLEGRFFNNRLSLDQILTDPILLHYKITKFSFDAVVTEGDFPGILGACHEFDTQDGGGKRDNLWYSTLSMHYLYEQNFLLKYFGYWDKSLATDKKEEIESLMRSGSSDWHSKAVNGYAHRAHSGEGYSICINSKWVCPITEDFANTLGYLKERIFWDNFEDENLNKWDTIFGTWTFVEENSWSGRTQIYDPMSGDRNDNEAGIVSEKYLHAEAEPLALIISQDLPASDYSIYLQLRVNGWKGNDGIVGIIGRYTDKDNYYRLQYNQKSGKIQIIKRHIGEEKILAESFYFLKHQDIHVQYLRAKFIDNKIEFYINEYNNDRNPSVGIASVSAIADTHDKGKIGLYAENATVQYDDIFVTTDN